MIIHCKRQEHLAFWRSEHLTVVTLVRALEAVLDCGAISVKMTKPYGAGEPPSGQKGVAAGKSVGTVSETWL